MALNEGVPLGGVGAGPAAQIDGVLAEPGRRRDDARAANRSFHRVEA